MYARAFLEGRLTEGQLDHFRREVLPGAGLSSYPHPRLMPDFWEFPTVSMGLGPISAIYQARFNRYLHNRELRDTSGQRVWAFLGDGEMDEPEALAGLSLAAREGLENLSDDDLTRLRRGGHDYRKVYAAYKAATEYTGAPTAILVHTIKGWTLGSSVEARNITHQAKKLSEAELKIFRDRLELPIPDAKLKEAPYYHPGPDSPEVEYIRERRKALGGSLPKRTVRAAALPSPAPEVDGEFAAGSEIPVSTTMAFTRLLRNLIRDKSIGKRIVPIIPDEARTFGMDPLFKEVGIYAALGQRYEPVDSDLVLSYREARDGQVLEEGITEAGSMASLQAAGTAYGSHGMAMVPVYLFYSMFGFQR